jgi:hypothetical protein
MSWIIVSEVRTRIEIRQVPERHGSRTDQLRPALQLDSGP